MVDDDGAAVAAPLTVEQQRRVESEVQQVEVIAKTLRRRYGSRMDLDEMTALGHEGLVRAAQTFVPDKDLAFMGYAWLRIQGAILDGIRREVRRAKVNEAIRRALEDFAEAPRSAGDYQDSDEQVDAHIASALRHAMDSLVVSLAMRQSESPEDTAVQLELQNAITSAVNVLPDAHRELVRLRYLEGRDMDEVARELRVGGATARRRQVEAMSRIRMQLTSAGLVER